MKNKIKGLIVFIITIMVFIPTSVFAHQVTFETNGGNSIDSQEVENGGQVTRPTNPTRNGYEFSGWYSDIELTDYYDFSSEVTSDITLYANWLEIINDASVTLTLPEIGANPVVTGTPGDSTKYDVDSYDFVFRNLEAEEDLSSTDTFEADTTYRVLLWFTPKSGYYIPSTANVKINGIDATHWGTLADGRNSVSFYINYTTPKAYSVTFNTNGGNSIDSQTIIENNLVTQPANPTRNGYRFAGWYSDSELTEEFDFANTQITEETTIYAKWNQEYTLTVLTNEPTCQVEYNLVKYNSGYTIKAIAGEEIRLFAKASEGYIFTEATSNDVSITLNGSIGRIVTMPESNATITFNFIMTYTVTFNTNGGNSIDNQVINSGAKATQPSDPTRNGYVFDGWYTDNTLTTPFDFDTAVNSNVTIYAKWIKIGDNYNMFANSMMDRKYIIEQTGDITNALYSTLNTACSAASSLTNGKYVMVYLPSGNYTVSEKSFMVCSNVYFITEDNTIITKTSGDNLGMFRIRNTDTNNVLIYGGTLDLNNKGKNAVEIMNSNNVRIEKVNIKNSTNAGVRIDNSQNVDFNDVSITNNSVYGIHETNSTLRVVNSNISNNGTGVYANTATLALERTKVSNNTNDGVSLKDSTFTSFESQYNNNNNRGIYSLGTKVTSESDKIYSNKSDGLFANQSSTVVLYKTNSYKNGGQGFDINQSTANIKKCNTYSNTKNGIYVTNKSKVTLKETKVYSNGENGVQVIGGSLLYANSNAQNEVTKNNYSGISASGKGTKIYVDGNIVSNNGVKPKISDEGEVAHGIGVTENAYGEITNNKLNDNKGCGISVFNYGTTKIVGNEINRNGRHGIGARNNNTITEITKNTINNNVLNGVLMSYKTNGPVNNNIIQYNGNLGLSVVDGSIVTAASNNISYNQMNNVSVSNAKNVSGGSLTLKANNIIEGSVTGHGIAVSGGTSLIINASGNKIQSNKQNGISVIENSKLNISATTTIYGNGETGVHIKDSDAQIKSAKIRKNGGYGVFLNNAGNLIIWKSYIENNKSYGFNLTGRQSIAKITKCEINGNDIAIMANSKVSANRISNNKIRNNKSTAIFVKNGSYVRELLGNTIENNNGYGIYANNSKIRLIKSNNILSNKDTGIVIRNGAVANEISYNNIKNNAYEGIYVNSASVEIIKYNNMVANGEVGILAKANAKIDSIYRNAINNHTKYGIASYSSTLTSVTKTNTYKGNGKKNYYKSA